MAEETGDRVLAARVPRWVWVFYPALGIAFIGFSLWYAITLADVWSALSNLPTTQVVGIVSPSVFYFLLGLDVLAQALRWHREAADTTLDLQPERLVITRRGERQEIPLESIDRVGLITWQNSRLSAVAGGKRLRLPFWIHRSEEAAETLAAAAGLSGPRRKWYGYAWIRETGSQRSA